jgi:hypothetical protein
MKDNIDEKSGHQIPKEISDVKSAQQERARG